MIFYDFSKTIVILMFEKCSQNMSHHSVSELHLNLNFMNRQKHLCECFSHSYIVAEQFGEWKNLCLNTKAICMATLLPEYPGSNADGAQYFLNFSCEYVKEISLDIFEQ